jgi:hypothetical protein
MIERPYVRCIRPFKSGEYYPSSGDASYVRHRSFCQQPIVYIRSFISIQNQVRKVFDYVEPNEKNKNCYSREISNIFLLTCIQVESNLKAILRENKFRKTEYLNISDYKKIEASHRLSSYVVKNLEWVGDISTISPFEDWSKGQRLQWYEDYNLLKHNIGGNLELATMKNMLTAYFALFVLITSQFGRDDFSVDWRPIGFSYKHNPDEYSHGIGGYLQIKYPLEWNDADRYEFTLTKSHFDEDNFCQKFDYDAI